MRTVPVFALLLGLLALLAPGAGCERPVKLAEVKGRVTFQGKPPGAGVQVLFSNPNGGTDILAPLDADGYYRVGMAEGYGLPPAPYQVAVHPPPLNPNFPTVPKRYRDPKTSGLTLDLTPDGAEFNIDMKP
ncbi:MAG: carboxypeptidase-like regulatory domain-containing protein [Gemmataceae bacterium]|nr:carboxypeptidase-like regulatory domain-containing protein [Gemmataceae bacterium]